MENQQGSFNRLAATSRGLAKQLLTIGENRIELLSVEWQEERERLVSSFLLGLGVGAFGLLAAMTLTAAIAVYFWSWSPVAVLLILTVVYVGAAVGLGLRLKSLLRDWQTFSASIDQIRKDRACLEGLLG